MRESQVEFHNPILKADVILRAAGPKDLACTIRVRARDTHYQRHFPTLHPSRYSSPMATATKKFLCMQCEMPEDKCDCEKYCAFCQGQVEVRLCQDGLYYCVPCREAADYKTQEQV